MVTGVADRDSPDRSGCCCTAPGLWGWSTPESWSPAPDIEPGRSQSFHSPMAPSAVRCHPDYGNRQVMLYPLHKSNCRFQIHQSFSWVSTGYSGRWVFNDINKQVKIPKQRYRVQLVKSLNIKITNTTYLWWVCVDFHPILHLLNLLLVHS